MKRLITFLLIVIVGLSAVSAQNFLTRTQVDQWPTEETVAVPQSYNRVSSYLYIINKHEFLNIFNGAEYTKEDRRKLGIRKDDKPDFLQMSIDIKHPSIAQNNAFTIPLFLFDFRDKNATNTFSNYNGMILNDIKASELGSDVMGSLNVKALISNASVTFWKEVAKISADLGKSATSIALGDPSGITGLTSKLTGYLDEGINALDGLSDDTRTENHSFFVTLVNREASAEFDEIVTSARLYQVHWSGDRVRSDLGFFSELNTNDIKPSSFESAIDKKSLPFVLIVETRSRTKINKGNPEFSIDYNEEIADEYEDYPIEEHPMFKEYYRNFNSAFNAYNYVNNFNSTINTSDADWNSLINAINYSYQYKIKVGVENSKYASSSYSQEFKTRYEVIQSRYETVDHLVNELYRNSERNIYLEQADGIIKSLLNELNSENATTAALYNQIVILSNYDNIIHNIDADASNFISNASYQRYKELKNRYEAMLFSKLNQNMPSTNEGKLQFYEKIISDYPICLKCISESNTRIQSVSHKNLQVLIEGYNNLSNNQYSEFNECRKQLEAEIINMKAQIDTTLDDFERKLALKSMIEFENNLKIWKDNIGKETIDASSEQIGLWTAAILESRKKIRLSYRDLKIKGVVSIVINCLD